MSSILNNLFIELKHGVERHENRPLLKCAMAACALVAEADGVVSFSERVCLDNILETLEALKIFNPHEGVNLFNGFVDDIRADPVKGRLKALKAISDVGPSRKTAELLMKV
ncbi:MAG: tellurite resistance TerB family protein, partial [Rhodospirillales bacterium]|nr:tellurite resistance TerB family protein [Rhodospirillales bacterium]